MPFENKIVTVKGKALAWGRGGVGKVIGGELEGLAVFVENLLPQEIARVELKEVKKRFGVGLLVELIETSPNRVTPRCKHYDICGGCSLQHINSRYTQDLKIDMLRSEFKKNSLAVPIIDEFHESPAYGFRRRVLLHREEGGGFGFYSRGTQDAFKIKECPVLEPVLELTLKDLNLNSRVIPSEIKSLFLETDSGSRVYAELRSEVRIDLDDELIGILKKCFYSFSLLANKEVYYSSGERYYLLDNSSSASIVVQQGSFSQTNSLVNKVLVKAVVSKVQGDRHVFDLYAGSGNFSIPIAKEGSSVCAVESARSAEFAFLSAAKKQNVEDKVKFYRCSTEKFLRHNSGELNHATILVDPPRSGLSEKVVEGVAQADKLIYVSCSLPSFIRDLKKFQKRGLVLSGFEVFDMFPQTTYMELLGIFSR